MGRLKLLAPGTIRGDATRIYGIQMIQLILGLVAGIIIARVLGPADKGIVDLFFLLQSFIAEFGMLGFNSGLLFYIANRARPVEEVHGTGVAFSLLAGAVAAFVGWLGLPLLRSVLPGLPDWAMLLALFTAPALLYRLIWSNLMTGLGRAVQSYRLELVTTAITLGIVAALWALQALTYASVVVLFTAIVALHAALGFRILFRQSPVLRPSRRLARQSLRYGAVIYVGFIANVLHFKVDQAMLNLFLGTSSVGVYAIAVRWAEMLFFLDNALIAASLFRVSSGENRDSHRLTKDLFKAQLLISGASGIGLAIVAGPMVLLLYGEEYAGSVLPMVLLIPGVIAWSLAKVLSQHIVYNRGKQWIPSGIAVAGIVANIGLNYIFIPRMGMAGAALASVASYTTVLIATGIAFHWLNMREA